MIKNSLGILFVVLGLLYSCVDHNTFNSKVQLENDIAAIKKFVAVHDPDAIPTSEGVYYVIDTVGLGIYPVVSDSIHIEYSIRNIPDLVSKYSSAQQSISDQKKLKLLSNVIAGLQIGLPRFPKGSHGRIYVPSGLAFGTTGNNIGIGPNENLVITVKLDSIKGNQFSTDTAAVTKYLGTVAGSILAANGGKFVKDRSGIWYWYDTLYANSLHPNLTNYKKIRISQYSARVFNATHMFENFQSPLEIDLTQQVNAWKIILPKISKGSKLKMYVPSGYGYGSNITKPPIPLNDTILANSNLIYEMKLDSVY